MPLKTILACTFFTVTATTPSLAADSASELIDGLKSLIADHDGDVAVSIQHLESAFEFSHRADDPMPTASLIKLPVMVEAYRQSAEQTIDLSTPIKLKESDKVPGSGNIDAALFCWK